MVRPAPIENANTCLDYRPILLLFLHHHRHVRQNNLLLPSRCGPKFHKGNAQF